MFFCKTQRETKEAESKQKQEESEQYKQELRKKASTCVLTISASDYVTAVGKKLTDYYLRSIFCEGHYSESKRVFIDTLEEIVEQAEAIGAEVVVDTKLAETVSLHDITYLFGTALIPKANEHGEPYTAGHTGL